MQDPGASRRIVRDALAASRYAVLATESGGQPHASLMAFAVRAGGRELVFATYRDTRKHANLVANPRVAVFIEHHEAARLRAPRRVAVTATGRAVEAAGPDLDELRRIYLERHPELDRFVAADTCALVTVAVDDYQVAGGIDDIGGCSAADLTEA